MSDMTAENSIYLDLHTFNYICCCFKLSLLWSIIAKFIWEKENLMHNWKIKCQTQQAFLILSIKLSDPICQEMA